MRQTTPLQLCLIMLSAAASLALADQITLTNGDRLTGVLIRSDAKEVTFKSDYAGEVKIPWAAVAGITSAEPVYAGLKSGQMLTGKLTLSGAQLVVETRDAGRVDAARENLDFLRSKEEQAAWEADIDHLRNPRLIDLWTGYVDFGVALARGNARTTNINTNAIATRSTSRDKIGVYFTSLYASSKNDGVTLTTANAIRGGIRYDLNLTPRVFAFGQVDLEYDQFQSLDLRFSPSGGLGYHVWRPDDQNYFDVFGGIAMNREFFSNGTDRTSAEGLVGEELLYTLSERTTFHEKLSFYPNFSRGGEYRMNFDASLNSALWRWFSWQFTVSDRLLSDPVPGRKKNDVLFTTGLRLTFAPAEKRK
jgi:putative salt-induced outer membrane protein YdiY